VEGKRGDGRYKGSLLLREEMGGKREGRGRGREMEGPPGTCLHPPDMKSLIKPCL